jgi:hypothetical protein
MRIVKSEMNEQNEVAGEHFRILWQEQKYPTGQRNNPPFSSPPYTTLS